MRFTYSLRKMTKRIMPPSAASDLGLHSLPITLLHYRSPDYNGLNTHTHFILQEKKTTKKNTCEAC